jgi:shikimate dehydrogenase
MNSAQQRRVGIIGHPIGHTLSPAMHTAAFTELGLPFTYGVFDVTEEFLPALIASVRKNNFAGLNVTIPHKQHVIPLLDELTQDARTMGAVNTIVMNSGKLVGGNTDVDGIEQTLAHFKGRIQNASVVLLGAGGGARAAAYAIAKSFSPGCIRFYNRTTGRAEKIADEFRKIFPKMAFEVAHEHQQLSGIIAESTLIVNTTPAGMTPNIEALPIPPAIRFSNKQIIFDIIYTPVETAFLRRAKGDGAVTVNGVEMFVHQGAKAFELWTGKTFPVETARQAVLKALKAA